MNDSHSTTGSAPASRTRRAGALLAPTAAVVVALLLPFAAFLSGTWLTGRRLQIVETGSMEPTYPVGSMLVVEPVLPSDVGVGTPLVFEDPADPRRLVTHRVVEVIGRDNGLFFTTQGDANAVADPYPVPARLVRGTVEWQVPKLGRVLDWVRWPRGFVTLVVVPGMILLFESRRRRKAVEPAATLPEGAVAAEMIS